MWLVEFGQPHADFLEVYVDEWSAAYEVWLEASSRPFVIGGTTAAAVMNANRKKGARALGAADVFPFLAKLRKRRRRERSVEELTRILRALFPGRTRRRRNA